MSVLYRLSKVTSPKAKGYGKWYPRAVITQTVDTEQLAAIMQRNSAATVVTTAVTLAATPSPAMVAAMVTTMSRTAIKVWGFGPGLIKR